MKNIYTYCLSRGFESKNGLTYNQIKSDLISKFHIDFTPIFELGFRIWFFDNFYEEEAESSINYSRAEGRGFVIDRNTGHIPFQRSVDKVVYLKGEASLKYLDYLELIDARKSSKQAFLFSLLSILIAICSIAIPLFLKTEIKQPVKVIILKDTIENTNHSLTSFNYDTNKISK